MTKIKFPIIPNSRFMINSYHKTLDNDSELLVTVEDVLNDNEFSGLPVFERLPCPITLSSPNRLVTIAFPKRGNFIIKRE